MTWLDDVKAAYGEPAMEAGPIKRAGFEDDPAHEITSRVWFPGNVNHCIKIKRYARAWVVTVGSHRGQMPYADVTFPAEPTDEQMRAILTLTGFCSSPAPTCVVCGKPSKDAECGECFTRDDAAAARRADA